MACNENISNMCMDPIDSACVDYKGFLGENTKITDTCVNQKEVNEDVYAQLDEIIDNSNIVNDEELCIQYPVTEGKILPKSIFEKNREELCTLKSKVETLENNDFCEIDITGCNLNFGALVDPCGDPITKLGQLLQILIDDSPLNN